MRLVPLLHFCLLGVGLLSASGPAGAVPLGFGCITNELPGDCAIGEAQVSVDVTDPGGGQITFTFANAGAAASSITDVYWDDRGGALLGIASITNVLGVSFASPADPENLSGANNASPPFETTPGFSADSDTPVQQNGVNPGEQLVVTFDLAPGSTFAEVVADLTDGDLRIGVRVQGFASEGGESFVNDPIPEPGSLALVAAGVLVLARSRRRRP